MSTFSASYPRPCRHDGASTTILTIKIMFFAAVLLVGCLASASAASSGGTSSSDHYIRPPTAATTTTTTTANDFDPNVTEYWFDAVVDHFNYRPTLQPTFPLRYLVNEQYYDQGSNGPVIFYAGNEAPIDQFVVNSGFLWEVAQEFHGMIVFAEHRYYGKSIPFVTDNHHDGHQDDFAPSFSPQNISYLTVEQAMQDYNTLQLHIRNQWNMTRSQPFIVVGGSYGGNLALWLRLKYANLWAGALASSATPLKHLLRESNAFNKIVADVYGNVSRVCPYQIRKGWKELYNNIETQDGRQTIRKELNLCYMPEEEEEDSTTISSSSSQTHSSRKSFKGIADTIYGYISGALETMVQYGYPYETHFYNPVPGYPFEVACEGMQKATTGLGALKAAAEVYYNYTGQAGSCFDWISKHDNGENVHSGTLGEVGGTVSSYWNRMGQLDRLERHRHPAKAGEAATIVNKDWTGTAWNYQCCTEVYQPMPTNGITDFELPHVPNQTEYFERCRQRWDGVTPRPNWEEMTFWSSHIFQAGSNIFLSSGQLDPWRAAGIQSAPPMAKSSSSIIVRIIEKGAHHLDLRSSHPLDPPSVTKVRQEEVQAMKRWIQEWKEWYPSPTPPSSSSSLA